MDPVCGTLSCGSCSVGDNCVGGVCIPASCVDEPLVTTCGSDVCGTKTNNCGIDVTCPPGCGIGDNCVAGACVALAVVPSGYFSWWKFEDDASDETGNYDATVVGAQFVSDAERGGFVANFDGVDDYINVSDDPSLDIQDEITLSAWVKLNAAGAYSKIIIKPVSGGANPWELYAIDLQSNNRIPRFIVGDGIADGASNYVPGLSAIPIGEWYHIVGTYNKTTSRLYVNGSLVSEDFGNFDIGMNDEPLSIGGKLGVDSFNGLIDEVRIYNKSLNASEVLDIYNRGNKCTDVSQCFDNLECKTLMDCDPDETSEYSYYDVKGCGYDNVADDTSCADDIWCDGAETCAAGLCQAGVAECSGLTCEESSDSCYDCSGVNVCSNYGDPVSCGADTCSLAGACQWNGVACEDVPVGSCGSIEKNGITWTFGNFVQCGQYVNGDWWVVGPVNVIGVDPAPISGRHGSVINPVGGDLQGYDDRVYNYVPTLRFDFSRDLVAGESLVSTKSVTTEIGCTVPHDGNVDVTGYCAKLEHHRLLSAAVLTVVSTVPDSNSFRPPYVGTDKPTYLATNLRRDLLPKLSLTSKPDISFLDNVADQFKNVWLDHKLGWTARMMHPVKNMPNYGRYIGEAVSEASVLLMLDYTDEQKENLTINFVQTGIDIYHTRLNGGSWSADGGHMNGRKWTIILTGILLNNDNIKGVSWGSSWGEDGDTYYGQPTATYPGGKPLWGKYCLDPKYFLNECSGLGAKDCRDPAGLVDGCYNYQVYDSSPNWVGEALSAMIVKDASGTTGKQLWNHNAFFDFIDRREGGDVDAGSKAHIGFIDDMWDVYR